MDILDRFKRSEPLVAAEMVFEAINTREHWENELLYLKVKDPEDKIPPGIGDEEPWQLPYPTAHLEELRAATARLEATIQEVRNDHPIIWALWSEGAAEDTSLVFASALGSLEGPGSEAMVSTEAWMGIGQPGLRNGFDRWTDPVDGSASRRRFIAGDHPVELSIEGIHPSFGLKLVSGDPSAAKALIEASLGACDDPDRRKRLEATLEEIRASLKSAVEDGEQAAAALREVFQEAEYLYLKAQSEEQENHERSCRELIDQQVDSLI